MNKNSSVLKILEYNKGNFVSGELLADKLGVSRNYIWKIIENLKKSGYLITSQTNKGYRLDDNNKINSFAIEKHVKTAGLKIIYEEACVSTNTMLKNLAESGETSTTVLISGTQTGGRGRMGRTFFSPSETGLYISFLLHPALTAEKSLVITTAAAVAVCRVLKKYTVGKIGIKWVNDILIDSKKVCGILTEASVDVESGYLKYAVLGIGVNIFMPELGFPAEIASTASCVLSEPPDAGKKCKIAAEIIDSFFNIYPNLQKNSFLDEYRYLSVAIGKSVYLLNGDIKDEATVIAVNDDYSLTVLLDSGEKKTVNSGEISIRIKEAD